MLKLRDRVVLETSIRDAMGKFDAPFGDAEGFDQTTGEYAGLIYARPPEILSPQGLLVRADIVKQQVPRVPTTPSCPVPGEDGSPGPAGPALGAPGPSPTLPTPIKPRRFDGSVEIDINRPVKAFDTTPSCTRS
jgi:hypothetical protein